MSSSSLSQFAPPAPRQGRPHQGDITNRIPPTEPVVYLKDGERYYAAVLAAIWGARTEVLLEMYWFDSDSVGTRFRDALVAAASRGVHVQVMVDAWGSWGTPSRFFEKLRQVGEVRVYNPLRWCRGTGARSLMPITRRNHRKLIVVDRKIGFTGGFNLADQWLPFDQGGAAWRDDGISVSGDTVKELVACFQTTWKELQDTEATPKSKPLAALFDLRAWRERSRELLRRSAPASGAPVQAGEKEIPIVEVLPQARHKHRRRAMAAYLRAIYLSNREIWISNAYFVPTRKIVKGLVQALGRGVRVVILVPARSDVPVVLHASRAVWGRLLRSGAEIYEWQPSVLHSKTATIDNWSTLGSFNLDTLSIRSNLELNISVHSVTFAQEIRDSLEADLSQCVRVDPRAFLFRSLGERLLERIAYLLRSWL